ncbi:hypothetical protein HPB47_021451 [Ixodes persulcatus]|uniref:Uncharacterized protein n=1 Tax=Ixodes persulcatus TaxID=34615 RepID=A0AC60QEZ0_IXOPE|nr:hypothetical protein HPB47_021451 [Ixodes persulcatus]
MCCGPQRCLQLSVQDFRGQEVMRFIRPCRCTSCCCPCCLQTIEVQAPPGTTIGHVNQDWSICFPNFTVCSRTGNALVKVKGPFCTESLPCCGDVKFREYFTDADNFGVSFPLDMDVYCKAALLACTMLIALCNALSACVTSGGLRFTAPSPAGKFSMEDYMFFEKTPTGKHDAPGMLD